MFRYQSHKQALIIAALVILLCLVCLTGATFALFTNDPNDGTIGVVVSAGKVDIDIVDEAGNSLQNEALIFLKKSHQDEILFQPGATFYTQGFKVINLGSVPVRFTISVSKDDRINMEEFNKAFDVWLVPSDDPNFDNAEQIQKFKGDIPLDGTSKTYHLFVKMKEDAGNEFQNKRYEGIGITVSAVQGNGTLEE